MSVATGKNMQQSATLNAMEKIKQLIFSGELAGDSNHLESELAKRLGISRTPVREATLMLQAQGLLEVQPRKGIKVKAISVNDMIEIYGVLTELECFAVRQAAELKPASKDLKSMRKAIKEMDIAMANGDREAWLNADETFHEGLIQLSRNKQIEDLVNKLNDQIRRARIVALNLRPMPVKSNTEHRKICHAIIIGDAILANNIHRQHRETAQGFIINVFKNAGLKRL